MPVIDPEELETLAARIFGAVGVAAEDARWVATLLVRANLRGHDSHGVIRIPQYVKSVQDGQTNPRPGMKVLVDTSTTAVVDGDWGFGQVVGRYATEVALEKAARAGVAAVGAQRVNHIGRLADYAEMAAERGFIGMLWTNTPTRPAVVPYGGISPRLSTNPLAVAVPGPAGVGISVDLATSVVAEGKVRVKQNRREPLPEGWAIDSVGNPLTDSARFYGPPRAGLLPMAGHKGTALSLVVEVLGGILSGAGAISDQPGPHRNGVFLIMVDVSRFLPLAELQRQLGDLVGFVKSSMPASGVHEVLVPGEPEFRAEIERRRSGIPVDDETWRQVVAAAAAVGIDVAVP